MDSNIFNDNEKFQAFKENCVRNSNLSESGKILLQKRFLIHCKKFIPSEKKLSLIVI